jgi:hypothetical protein
MQITGNSGFCSWHPAHRLFSPGPSWLAFAQTVGCN